jgi:hypothetical protein
MLVRIAFVVLFLGLAAMFLAGVKDIPPRGAGDWFNIAIALACIYAAITYPMRAVVFTQGTVRVQSMGRCRTNRLPARVRVQPGLSLGSLYVVDDANQQVLVIVKREFGPIASLEARIKSWLRGEGRLAEPQEASAARTGTNRAR